MQSYVGLGCRILTFAAEVDLIILYGQIICETCGGGVVVQDQLTDGCDGIQVLQDAVEVAGVPQVIKSGRQCQIDLIHLVRGDGNLILCTEESTVGGPGFLKSFALNFSGVGPNSRIVEVVGNGHEGNRTHVAREACAATLDPGVSNVHLGKQKR